MDRRSFLKIATAVAAALPTRKVPALLPLGGSTPTGFLPAGHWVNSPITLTAVAPRTGMVSIRYQKAYPGLLYRVPVVAMGGAWPYVFTLLSAPSGMTIGSTYSSANYGVITWSNPIAGTYTITVQVQDQAGSSPLVITWTLTVSTTNFIFIDSVNGHASVANGGTGTGTLANPFQNLDDWYSGAAGHAGTLAARKADATYRDNICYYRNGTYPTSSCGTETWNTGNPIGGNRVPLVSNNKPKVHLAYPGESPVWDVTAAALQIYGDSTYGWWMHGLTSTGVNNSSDQKFIAMDAGVTDTVLFENIFSAQTGTTSNNPTPFMITANAPSIAEFVAIVSNIYQGVTNAELTEQYDTQWTAFHNNFVSNSSEATGGGAYFKEDCAYISVRGNTSPTSPNNSTCLCRYDNFKTELTQGTQMEICWNNYETTGPSILFGTFGNNWGTGGIFRNTWRGQFCQVNVTSGTGSGTFNVSGDVNIGDGTQTNNWDLISWAGTLTFDANYLTGTAGTGIVDSAGNLQGAFRTTKLGLSGHEIA